MTIRVDCACGAVFDAPDGLAGGFANCPRCGRATAVPGLRDAAWRGLQALAVVLVAAAAAFAWGPLGPGGALLVALALAALLWLLSRAL